MRDRQERPDPGRAVALAAAYEHCAGIAYSHYENFPVASWLLPARMRPHIAAIYAFARTADDFADEPGRSPDERYRLLNEWKAKLHGCLRADSADPIFLALANTIRERQLPVELFDDLLSAFRQDVSVHRYETWDDVLDYCRRSANPVGRLVLRVAGVEDDPAADRASDALCTALQLTNFWQDFGVDWSRGRLYIPREEVVRAGAAEADLDAKRMTAAWKSAMQACVVTTRALFEAGRPVTDAVTGRLRLELRATWFGGMRVLEKIEHLDFDTLNHRPTVGKRDVPALALRALVGKPV